jgi:hypothetical protein
MRRREDDLTAWQDDPVVRALTGPGTADELAGEEYVLAAFRAAAPRRSRRRYIGRLGVGGSALAIAVAFSGGAAAAAYTSSLPAPLQRAANDVGGFLGVPAVKTTHHHKLVAGGSHSSAPSPPAAGGASTPPVVTTPTPAPSVSPSSHHSVGPKAKTHPKVAPSAGGSSSATSPTPTPTSTPTPTPTPTSTPTVPPIVSGSITITVQSAKVPINSTVSVVGQLATPTGAPVSNRRVWLIERLIGQGTASEVASGLTSADGSVELTTPPLTQSVRLRLVVGAGVHSSDVTVVVVPTISAATTLAGSTYTVSVATEGADQGDTVTLQRRTASGWAAVATTQLNSAAGAYFSVPVPVKRTARYRIVLPRTPSHGSAVTRFAVAPV